MWRVRYARFRFVVLRKYQTKIKRKKKDTTKPSKKTKIFFFLEGEEKRLKFNEIFEQHKKKNLERNFKALSKKKKIFFFFQQHLQRKSFPA